MPSRPVPPSRPRTSLRAVGTGRSYCGSSLARTRWPWTSIPRSPSATRPSTPSPRCIPPALPQAPRAAHRAATDAPQARRRRAPRPLERHLDQLGLVKFRRSRQVFLRRAGGRPAPPRRIRCLMTSHWGVARPAGGGGVSITAKPSSAAQLGGPRHRLTGHRGIDPVTSRAVQRGRKAAVHA
jgi:hypothetical protein